MNHMLKVLPCLQSCDSHTGLQMQHGTVMW